MDGPWQNWLVPIQAEGRVVKYNIEWKMRCSFTNIVAVQDYCETSSGSMDNCKKLQVCNVGGSEVMG